MMVIFGISKILYTTKPKLRYHITILKLHGPNVCQSLQTQNSLYIYFVMIFEKSMVESKFSRNVHMALYPPHGGRLLPPYPTALSPCRHGARRQEHTEFFIYLFCHDFQKINGRIKIFEKCTSGAVPTPRRQTPAAVPHGVKSLPPSGTTAGAWFRRQGGAVWCQDPAAERHGGRSLPLRHTMLGLFYFFSFHF
jgi:hypothetical protein